MMDHEAEIRRLRERVARLEKLCEELEIQLSVLGAVLRSHVTEQRIRVEVVDG